MIPRYVKNRRTFQKGVTLIELMVSMVISLILIVAASSVYIAGKEGFRTNDDRTRNLESGRLAMDILSRTIRMAGAYGYNPGDPTGNYVFNEPTGQTPIFGAQVGGVDSLTVVYRSVDNFNPGTLQGSDCAGQPVGRNWVRNRFTVSPQGQLMCEGSINMAPIPIVNSVIDLQIRYAVVTTPADDGQPDTEFPSVKITDVTGVAPTEWGDVRAVHLCLEVISFEARLTDGSTPGLNCRGQAFPSDNRVHKVYRSVVNVRNHTRGSNFTDPT
jgi:type IV pilus assembly protein PilW